MTQPTHREFLARVTACLFEESMQRKLKKLLFMAQLGNSPDINVETLAVDVFEVVEKKLRNASRTRYDEERGKLGGWLYGIARMLVQRCRQGEGARRADEVLVQPDDLAASADGGAAEDAGLARLVNVTERWPTVRALMCEHGRVLQESGALTQQAAMELVAKDVARVLNQVEATLIELEQRPCVLGTGAPLAILGTFHEEIVGSVVEAVHRQQLASDEMLRRICYSEGRKRVDAALAATRHKKVSSRRRRALTLLLLGLRPSRLGEEEKALFKNAAIYVDDTRTAVCPITVLECALAALSRRTMDGAVDEGERE